MNFTHLQESIWRTLGLHDSSQRPDWQRQEIRDALNTAYMRLAYIRPFLFQLVSETTISLVNGTGTYLIDDWCVRPLSFYITGTYAREVIFRNPKTVDRDGSRNTNLVAGIDPWILTWTPATVAAVKSGAAAATTEASTAITGVSGTGSSDVGRMFRINGEDNDYKIAAVPGGGVTYTLDKAFKGYLTGLGTTGAASSYSGKKWEVGPPGRYWIQVLPIPTTAVTLSVRYQRRPRRLILDDDTPEIQEDYHDLIWKGAYAMLSGMKKDGLSYGIFRSEWQAGLEELRKVDELALWEEQDQAHYESMLGFGGEHGARRSEPPGTYHRY